MGSAPRKARFSIPGKIFVLGEYAVLQGGCALIATVPPRFELRGSGLESDLESDPESDKEGRKFGDFPAETPFRRFLRDAKRSSGEAVLDQIFFDPHRGCGGFGGSTAEFALAYAALNGPDQSASGTARIWESYRRLEPDASGADLAAQWVGGAAIANPASLSVERILGKPLFSTSFFFSAAHQPGRKVKTHEHLALFKQARDSDRAQALARLAECRELDQGLRAAREGDLETFARSVDAYADRLRELGLELPETSQDRAALREAPGVLAVKGSGAMQADAILVLCAPQPDPDRLRENLLRIAERRNLRLVTQGWREEAGISAEDSE